ncbi:hypothetical protein VQ056_24210 [Paenibacillus sp. JTLBN-2024]
MRLTAVFATMSFKLILEFDNREYRLLDIKQFLKGDKGKLKEIKDDISTFRSVKIDKVSGAVLFCNGVDFDSEFLYKVSESVDHILGIEGV